MIGIIAANNLRLSPYALYYIGILKEMGMDFEVIVPDRNPELKDEYDFNVVTLSWNAQTHSLINYTIYAQQVKKVAVNKYEFLIVLTTINAVFCCSWLRKYFPKRYIIDIRDYTYEHNKVYYWLECNAIKSASAVIISSSQFRNFLPDNEYCVCHNINEQNQIGKWKLDKTQSRIIIGYVGTISYRSQCERLMKMVVSDERFEFHFYGNGPDEKELRLYAQKLMCDRIKFFGSYRAAEKNGILKKIHILFNAYGNGTPLLDYALSNKLYDALYYHMPILTSPNTFMGEMGGPLAYPIQLDENESLDKLWDWYHQLDEDAVDQYAEHKYAEFIEEHIATKNRIKSIIQETKGILQ